MQNKLSKVVMACALVLGLAAVSEAQQPRDTATQPINTVESRDNRNDGMSMGWLGLVGLAGLMGLKRRDSHVHAPVPRTDSAHPSTAR